MGKHEPFIPAEMVATLDEIARTIRLELSHIRHHEHFVGTWWEEGERNSREVKRLTDALLEQVRRRAAQLRAEQEAEN